MPSESIEPLFDEPLSISAAAVVRDPDGKLRVRWPEGVDTVPIDELALRLLVDLANAGLRHGCAPPPRHMLDHRPITDDE